ncbi:268_t:CDS:2 [Diversispora eburnea]|uniref:268_t:CDS:1 n=1 Tax=Diversispora eburnea TaxID=1213867 RepID=A0A9N8YZD2_9GLOM|nr:268_t:CDS:2 [Diversispora eburnea]
MDYTVFSQEERDAETSVRVEFQNLNNNEVYEHVFRNRMLALKRGVITPRSPSDFLGVDSRELVYPSLCETFRSTVNNSTSNEFHILDVGAGSGEAIDWFFADELNNSSNRKNFIHIIEPNPILIKAYQQKFLEYKHLSQGIIYKGLIQDYLFNNGQKDLPKPPVLVDFINCSHMIYYLTDYRKSEIDPYQDVIKFITFLYGLLKPGGAIYIVFHLEFLFLPLIYKYYEELVGDFEILKRISLIVKARKELLYEGKILEELKLQYKEYNEKTNSKPTLKSYCLESAFYARTLADMSVLAMTELLQVGDEKFDERALDFMITQVKSVALTPDEEKPFKLTKCIREDENVWCAKNLLIVCVIQKEQE